MSPAKIVKNSTAGDKPPRRRLHVLTRRSDFLRTFKSGRKIRPAEWMVFNYSISESFRCGWTCPKGIGNAPIRNRLKRWVRDWMRERLKHPEDPPNIDLNIGFRPMPPDFFKMLKRADFNAAMERGWKQIANQVVKTPADKLIKSVEKK